MRSLHPFVRSLTANRFLLLVVLLVHLVVRVLVRSLRVQSFQVQEQVFECFFFVAVKPGVYEFASLKLLLLRCDGHLSLTKSTILSREDFALEGGTCGHEPLVALLLWLHAFLALENGLVYGGQVLTDSFCLIRR